MSTTFLDAVSELSPPQSGYAVRQVASTNAFAGLDQQSRPLIIFSGMTDFIPNMSFRHFEFERLGTMNLTVQGQIRALQGVVRLRGDETVDIHLLGRIMDHLHRIRPGGNFRASDVKQVLSDVRQMVEGEERPPSREEVKGAWGELHFLLKLLQDANGALRVRNIVEAWEGDRHQQSIDFKFFHARIAIEMKTTESDVREHVIHGMGQVTLPDGFLRGFLGSQQIREAEGGVTNLEMVEVVRGFLASHPRALGTFEQRLIIRGRAALDNRIRFSEEGPLKLYKMEHVPRPQETADVTPTEWIASLENTTSIDAKNADETYASITEA